MKRYFPTTLALLLPLGLGAQDDDAARLREALKNVTLQLRTSQGETAAAQTAAIAAEQKAKALEAKLADLERRHATLDRQSKQKEADTDKTIATLNNRVAERDKRLGEYIAALDKWKTGYEALAGAARAKEAEAAKSSDEVIVLKRSLADRERKNIALFNISTEILKRYEDFATGRSLAAKEPFIGTARVQIENLVQGYRDKILDNRLNTPPTTKKP